MALFLQRKNNLKDVADVYAARENLGIGTLAYQNSNDVRITGGSVSVDELVIRGGGTEAAPVPGQFLVCSSNDGRVGFVEMDLGDWIHKDPSEINVGDFDHSGFVFLNRASLCNVAFTADFDDILYNRPNFYSDLSNDVSYLYRDLRNVDVPVALSNLGIGTLAFRQSNDEILFEDLVVTRSFVFAPPDDSNNNTNGNSNNGAPMFMQVRADGQVFRSAMPRASVDAYGVVRLADTVPAVVSGSEEDGPRVPTTAAVSAMRDDLLSRIDRIEAGDVSSAVNVVQTIDNNGLLRRDHNLGELVDKAAARSNLGFGSNMEALIASVNASNAFSVRELRVTSNLIFGETQVTNTINGLDTELIDNGTYLAVNSRGNVVPQNLPMATSSTPGFVFLNDHYDYKESLLLPHDRSTVLSVSAFDSFVNGVYIPLFHSISNNVEPKIRDMYGEFMRVSDNLRVENPSVARQHLQLHEVAHTGDYFQLENRPTALSAFENTPGFLVAALNLSDLTDPVAARSNLLLGSMALYDSNDVRFVRGDGSFSNLRVDRNLRYTHDDNNHSGDFLKCINTQGDCRWEPLPTATSTKKGVVRLESDFTRASSTKASSGAALYTAYTKLRSELAVLQAEVDGLRAAVAALPSSATPT